MPGRGNRPVPRMSGFSGRTWNRPIWPPRWDCPLAMRISSVTARKMAHSSSRATRRHFQPSASLAEPLVNVGVHVLCARRRKRPLRLATSRNLMKLRSASPECGVPSVEEAVAYPYRPEELAYLDQVKRSYVDGNPQQVKAKLEDLADLYQTTDLTIVTICHGFAERVRSYELLAEVCELKSGQ